MRRILQTVSWLALAGTIVPSFAYLVGKMELDSVKTAMLVSGIVWFVATPMWMHRQSAD